MNKKIKAYETTLQRSFIHRWDISQWRLTEYVIGIEELLAKGELPTDHSLAKRISPTYSRSNANKMMQRFKELGIVRVTTEGTKKGDAYELTGTGRKFIEDYRDVCEQVKAASKPLVKPQVSEPAPKVDNSTTPSSVQTDNSQGAQIALDLDNEAVEVDESGVIVDMPGLVVSQQQTVMFQQVSISKLLKQVEVLNETVANLEGEIREVDEFMDLLDDQNREMEKLQNYISELEAKAA